MSHEFETTSVNCNFLHSKFCLCSIQKFLSMGLNEEGSFMN